MILPQFAGRAISSLSHEMETTRPTAPTAAPPAVASRPAEACRCGKHYRCARCLGLVAA